MSIELLGTWVIVAVAGLFLVIRSICALGGNATGCSLGCGGCSHGNQSRTADFVELETH